MKRFQFRLARVQRLRERTLQERQVELAEVIEHQQKIEAEISRLDSDRTGEKDSLRDYLGQGTISIDHVIQSHLYDGSLRNAKRQLESHLEQVRRLVDFRRARVLDAEKDVKVLEKLGEKARQRYDADVSREDQQLLDELALQSEQRRHYSEG
ncbi:Flagellar FliJ protein [Planctomycetes bacterium Pan216]|uniref:Flagellar FliJ protein n=1 Tax=Kolteria novifilia TaxID=2527975 RepID=A0A518B6I1_9BACT|nr:Flagellar FliJ protein [Planctomycetes bacterium Pan216]